MTDDRRSDLFVAALRRTPHGSVLDRVCAALPPMLDVTAAGVALLSAEGGGGAVTTAGAGGATIFDLPFSLGEGPLLTAFTSGVEVLVPDLATADRAVWPAFIEQATAAGVAASFTFPLQVGAIRLGVLHLQRDRPGHLSVDHTADARIFAEIVTTLLIDRQAGVRDVDAPTLTWPDQSAVHQATGVLATQLGCGLAPALALLRAYAFSTGTALDIVARRVVAGELRIEP